MAHTYEELRKKRVVDLREIAKGIEHEALHGHSTMHKDQLVHALCTALEIDAHEHHRVIGIDKRAIKGRIQELKKRRAAALEARDAVQLKRVRRRIQRLKRKIRAATV